MEQARSSNEFKDAKAELNSFQLTVMRHSQQEADDPLAIVAKTGTVG